MHFKAKPLKNLAHALQQKFDRIVAWGSESGRLCRKPYVTEREGILCLHFDTLSVQSEMYIDMPDELVIPYTRTMMSFLLLSPAPCRIAMIGLGGGSLAKYCYRHLPQSEIRVIEINPDVIALRNEFAIPADDQRFQVWLDNGAEWVKNTDWQPEILIADGFDTDGLPSQLASQCYYDDCFAALSDNGIMVVNLWGGYPHYEDYLARIHTSFSDQVLVVDAEDSVNKIVFAIKGNTYPPTSTSIKNQAKLLDLSHPLDFLKKSTRLIRALQITHHG